MPSNVAQRFSGASPAARLNQRAARRSRGVYGQQPDLLTRMPGSQCRAFQRAHMPMAQVCHATPAKEGEAA